MVRPSGYGEPISAPFGVRVFLLLDCVPLCFVYLFQKVERRLCTTFRMKVATAGRSGSHILQRCGGAIFS